jgi:hypothetical protein
MAITIAIKPFSLSSLPTFGPTISTLLISKLPVPFKTALASSPISLPSFFVEVLTLIIISSSLPKYVTDASLKTSLLFKASLQL